MSTTSISITLNNPDTPSLQTNPNKKVSSERALLCLMVVVMDLTAGILGIEAENAQDKIKRVTILLFECEEPSHQAFILGLSAAGLLVLAHVIASFLGGCVCICSKEELKRSSTNKIFSAASHVLVWIIVAVGIMTLVIGAFSNTYSNRPCGISRHSLLSIGGVLCFFHGLVCTVYYVSATAAVAEEDRKRSIGTQTEPAIRSIGTQTEPETRSIGTQTDP